MRKPYERDIQKEILDKCFNYLVNKGLGQASVKNLCEETGISSGSIYYWFKDRNEMILDSAKYGLGKVIDEMFRCEYIKRYRDETSGISLSLYNGDVDFNLIDKMCETCERRNK